MGQRLDRVFHFQELLRKLAGRNALLLLTQKGHDFFMQALLS
jgi:hypothetical protein